METQNIVFFVSPVLSHLNASFTLANLLKDEGFNIVYAGDIEYTTETQERIIDKGYEFFHIPTNSIIQSYKVSFTHPFLKKIIYLLLNKANRTNQDFRRKLYQKVFLPGWYLPILEKYTPKLFVVDIFYIEVV